MLNTSKGKKMTNAILLAFLCIALIICAQTLLKLGVNHVGGINITGGQITDALRKIFTSPYILTGIIFYAASAVLWLDVLSRLDISLAYPLVSLSYAAAIIIGALAFHEPISLIRIAAVILICGGVVLLIKS